MITIQETDRLIREAMPTYASTTCRITEAVGRILREDIYPDRDLPPFDRVTMDGIAISSNSMTKTFAVERTHAAGRPRVSLRDAANGCIEVMTGSVLPEGCDCVVPYEEISLCNNEATLGEGAAVERLRNVHVQGSGRKTNEKLIEAGCRLTPAHIGTIASVGMSEVEVGSAPSVAVISNGDELVDLGKDVKPHQIRPSNSYALLAGLKARRIHDVKMHHLPDDEETMTAILEKVIRDHDVLVLSGGVSMGKFDLMPKVLEALGVKPLFHKVSQRPGKPFWFGLTSNDKPVFALPGNPASTLVCFRRYVIPHLECATGLVHEKDVCAALGEEIHFSDPLTYFVPVTAHLNEEGMLVAIPVAYKGSGDLAGLSTSDGFVELEKDRNQFPDGLSVPFYGWT